MGGVFGKKQVKFLTKSFEIDRILTSFDSLTKKVIMNGNIIHVCLVV